MSLLLLIALDATEPQSSTPVVVLPTPPAQASERVDTTVFSQLRDGSQRVELPAATDISYEYVLSQPGECSFTLPALRLPDADGNLTIPLREVLRPGVHEIGVRRGGTVVWLGPLVPFDGDEIIESGETGSYTFSAQGLGYYPFRWTIDVGLGTFTNIDQALIVKALIDHHQAKGGGDFNLDTSLLIAVGVLRTRTEYDSWRGLNIGEQIQALAEVADGFDWQVRPADRAVLVHHPRRGRRRSNVTFNPANLRSLRRSASYEDQASRVRGFGDGNDSGTLQVSAQDSEAVAEFGLTEEIWQGSGITNQTTLAAHAAAELAKVRRPPTTLTLRVRFGDNLPYGSFEVGDEIRVVVPDSAYEPIDEWRRVLSVKHFPPGTTGGLEEADVMTAPVAG
jgi:hypothetical protein